MGTLKGGGMGVGVVAVSCGRGAVGVAQHGVEGAGKVVGQCAAVVVLSQGHQAGQH